MKKTYASILFLSQMLDSYKMFVYSRTFFVFRNYNIRNKEFKGDRYDRKYPLDFIKDINYKIRRIFKKILGLPPTVPNSYLYTAIQDGGVGFVALRDAHAV